jgi:hypothetical protein
LRSAVVGVKYESGREVAIARSWCQGHIVKLDGLHAPDGGGAKDCGGLKSLKSDGSWEDTEVTIGVFVCSLAPATAVAEEESGTDSSAIGCTQAVGEEERCHVQPRVWAPDHSVIALFTRFRHFLLFPLALETFHLYIYTQYSTMSGHHHGHGHCDDESHDHDHDHGDAPGTFGPQDNLFSRIDTGNVVALNTEDDGKKVIKPWDQRLDETSYIESDADDQMYVYYLQYYCYGDVSHIF